MSDTALSIVKSDAMPIPQPQSETAAVLSIIERAARDPAISIEKVERMFELHQRMAAQQAKASFLAAMSKMQAELPAAARKGKAHNDKAYARFEDVIEALRPVMAKHGFSLTFRMAQSDKAINIVGVLGHCDGHTEQTEMTLPADTTGGKNLVQAWGSAASYGKRYVTLTLTGIATEDDDDGRGAARPVRKSSAASKRDGTDKRFNEIKELFETAPDIHSLRELSRSLHDEINTMPEGWASLLSDAWDLRAETLKART